MASEKSSYGEDAGAAALADEVRALRALLEEVQAELKPAVQSSLRERSTELQRQGAELDAHREQAGRLALALEAVEARAAELEREAARWREAAHRGLDEIAGRARAQAALFDEQTQELNQALTAIRTALSASEAQASAAAEAHAAAMRQAQAAAADTLRAAQAHHAAEARSAAEALGKSRKQVRSLEAEAAERERQRVQMVRSVSWRITAPIRWVERLIKRLAHLRRRLTKS